MRMQVAEMGQRSDKAVQLRGLRKTYPGSTNIGCYKCSRSKPFHAVKVNNV